MKLWRLPLLAAVTLLAGWLAGCATTFVVESDVRAFGSLTALPAQPTYRFERLPSQQAPGQAEIEAVADPALYRAGLRRDDANPNYSVQVGARVQQVVSPWASQWGWGWGWGGWSGWGHGGYRHGWMMSDFDYLWYQREVSIIIRELPSNRVVYETHASSDGPTTGGLPALQAMFEAALQGFPNAPPKPFRVNIPVPS